MLPWKKWARVESDRKTELVGLWRAFRLIFKGWKGAGTPREWEGNPFRKRQRPACGLGLSTHTDCLLPLALAPGMDMDGGWPNTAVWEARCGPLVSILCVTSHLLLLQVMGILKHNLLSEPWARRCHLETLIIVIGPLRHSMWTRYSLASTQKYNQVQAARWKQLSKSIKRTRVWKAKVIF